VGSSCSPPTTRPATSTASAARTTSSATPWSPSARGTRAWSPSSETFPIGGSKVLRGSDHDQVTLVGAGVTLHACLAAADILADQGITARVIDAYSIKPLDSTTLAAAATATGGRIVVAEDHHPEGRLGSAVIPSLIENGIPNLRVTHLAVRGMPGSGNTEELLAWAGIDAEHIADAACN